MGLIINVPVVADDDDDDSFGGGGIRGWLSLGCSSGGGIESTA